MKYFILLLLTLSASNGAFSQCQTIESDYTKLSQKIKKKIYGLLTKNFTDPNRRTYIDTTNSTAMYMIRFKTNINGQVEDIFCNNLMPPKLCEIIQDGVRNAIQKLDSK